MCHTSISPYFNYEKFMFKAQQSLKCSTDKLLYTSTRIAYTERKKIKRRNVRCPKSKCIRICLRTCFHREKKDKQKKEMFQIKIQQDLPQRELSKKFIFCAFIWTDLPLGDYIERRKTKRIIPIKMHQDLPQGELSQKGERQRKTCSNVVLKVSPKNNNVLLSPVIKYSIVYQLQLLEL